MDLTLDSLLAAVEGDVVALRSRLRLQPAGGEGDKIYPPTYGDGGDDYKYAYEIRTRRSDKQQEVDDSNGQSYTVLLDSVASQANRAEQALLDAYLEGKITFPVPYIDFSNVDVITEYDRLTVLDAPHRIADAIFRDSELNGELFRKSEIGKRITDASPRNATGIYQYSPSALLFGMWDSTGPKGGLGNKFQRAYVSEIVGHDANFGVRVGSRIDPLQIGRLPKDQVVYNHKDPDEVWTTEATDAEVEKGKPKPASRGSGEGTAGQPSKVNHGNILPARDGTAGGVTISYAEQISVLSLATLRKLRFDGYGAAPQAAARTAVAALGIAAMHYGWRSDFDLRSRCLLIAEQSPQLEILHRDGTITNFQGDLSSERVDDLVKNAARHAKENGLGWEESQIELKPSKKLLELMRRSQMASKTELQNDG